MRLERTFHIGSPPKEIWPLVANTDSLNRELGLPNVRYTFEEKETGGARVIAKASTLGQTLEWIEHPFEWTTPEEYMVEREFLQGPFRRMVLGTRLVPDGTGTRVEGYAEIEPKGLLGRVASKFGVVRSFQKFGDVLGNFESYLRRESKTPYPARAGRIVVDEGYLAEGERKLKERGAAPSVIPLMVEHLRTAPEEEVVGMRPFEMADRWKKDRLTVMRTFLHATRVGLVVLTWSVVCPACRGVKNESERLLDLPSDTLCESCQIRFRSDFDRAIEVRFTVHPAIRNAEHQTFCIGGPLNTPHIFAQKRVRKGDPDGMEIDLPAGVYLVTSPEATEPVLFEVTAEAKEDAGEITLEKEGIRLHPNLFHPGRIRFRMENLTEREGLVRIEQENWSDIAASAALVTSLQDFRDFFAHEMLSPGEQLSIQSLTLLFTDLKQSTELYERIGDALAYALVRKHFGMLTRIIRDHDGAVIKTMGDAVMAAFSVPARAVRAATAIQKEIVESPMEIKLGIHTGPCIAVTSNEKLDYFGSCVNLAQRVQSRSGGDDLILTEAVLAAPGVRSQLETGKAEIEPFESRLRGFEQKVPLFRIRFPFSRPAQ